MGSLSLLWGSSQPRDWTQISCITGGFFTSWATREALKELKMELLYDPAIPLLGIHPKKIKTLICKKYMYPRVHSSIIYYSQDMETTKVFIHRWMNGYRCEIHTHTHTHTHTMEYYSATEKEILLFATTWVDLEDIMLSEINQRKTNTTWPHLNVKSKKWNKTKTKLMDIENRLVSTRSHRRGVDEMSEGDQRYTFPVIK